MPTALVISPHLDDAVFSCGATMAQLADAGWRVVMATAFTRSIHPAQGFALACQLDKGLPPDVDYMALRRAEDLEAARILGAEPRFLDLPEAPHRGYASAADLFRPVHDDDIIWRALAADIAALVVELGPALLLGPQGLGDHVDHVQTIRAIAHGASATPLAFYRDTPYAIRNPGALRDVTLPAMSESAVGTATGLDRKVRAACAYASQVGFQFGGAAGAAAALREFALAEGNGTPVERFLGTVPEHLSACVSQD